MSDLLIIFATFFILYQLKTIADYITQDLTESPPAHHELDESSPPYSPPSELTEQPRSYSAEEEVAPELIFQALKLPATVTPAASPALPIEDAIVFDPIHNLLQFHSLTSDFVPQLDNILTTLQEIAKVPQAHYELALVNYFIETKDDISKHIESQTESIEKAINESSLAQEQKNQLIKDYGTIIKDAMKNIDDTTVADTKAAIELFKAMQIPEIVNILTNTIVALKEEQLKIASRLTQIPDLLQKSFFKFTEPVRQATRAMEQILKHN